MCRTNSASQRIFRCFSPRVFVQMGYFTFFVQMAFFPLSNCTTWYTTDTEVLFEIPKEQIEQRPREGTKKRAIDKYKPKSFSNDPKIEFTSTREITINLFSIFSEEFAQAKVSNAIIQFIEILMWNWCSFARRSSRWMCADFDRCCSHVDVNVVATMIVCAHFNSIYWF